MQREKLTPEETTLKRSSHNVSKLRFVTNDSNSDSHETIFSMDSSTIGILLGKHKLCNTDARC